MQVKAQAVRRHGVAGWVGMVALLAAVAVAVAGAGLAGARAGTNAGAGPGEPAADGDGAAREQGQARPAVSLAKDVAPFLTRHCYDCHGRGKNKGDVALDAYTDEHTFERDRDVWETVLERLQNGEMPPKGRPRPPAAEAQAAIDAINTLLARFDCAGPRNVGRVTLRRLNRAEYNNTIRDLVGVDFQPAADFPSDDVGYGFDNIGDVLSLSPILLEKYLAAAESICEQAVVNVDPPKPSKMRLGELRVFRSAGELVRGRATLHSRGQVTGDSYFDEGDYTVQVEAYGHVVGDEPVRAALKVGSDTVQEFEILAGEAEPATLEAKVHLKGGNNRISVAFLNPNRDPDHPESDSGIRKLYVRRIMLDGPYNAPPPVVPESHKRIMRHAEGAPPRAAAREIVSRFATRAFRRPVQDAELDRFLLLYDQAEREGGRFEDAVRLALEGVLVSPHFLFRVELDPPGAQAGTAYPVGEYELASRLSYFLWSTMPDDELFALAARGQLRANLEPQVRRMLKDAKSAAFVENFAGQWLTLRKLATVAPDTAQFPAFDESLRAAMARETELFFDAIVHEDRSILDLIDADFSFVNERLAKHYGIEGVTGKEFQRVKLPANRGGILTQASILTLTSNPTRTSPVKRGKWVLEQILNSPPPPPPPDVPALDEQRELKGSLRTVMEQHRANAICASCHQRMDPIGFAFENYDAVGAWRTDDGKFPIDASGVLPDGRSFQGPAELKAILKQKKDTFSRCLAEKLLTYALGRGLEYYDRCAVDKILEDLGRNDFRFSALVLGVVRSEPFQMRTATGETP